MIKLYKKFRLYVLCIVCGIVIGIAFFIASNTEYSKDIYLTVDSSLDVSSDSLLENLALLNDVDEHRSINQKLQIKEVLKNYRPKKGQSFHSFKITAASIHALNEIDVDLNKLITQYLNSARENKISRLKQFILLSGEISSSLEKQSKASTLILLNSFDSKEYINSRIQLHRLQMPKMPYLYISNQTPTASKKIGLTYSVCIAILLFLFLGYFFSILRDITLKN